MLFLYVEICDEIQASWKALVHFCSFVSDQWLLRYGGVAPLHHYHSSWPLLPHQGEENKLLMLDLKHNVFSLTVTAANSFICFPLPPDETII